MSNRNFDASWVTRRNRDKNVAFRIGSFTDGSYRMNARLGYLKMFNSELSAGDILADYNTTRSRFGL